MSLKGMDTFGKRTPHRVPTGRRRLLIAFSTYIAPRWGAGDFALLMQCDYLISSLTSE